MRKKYVYMVLLDSEHFDYGVLFLKQRLCETREFSTKATAIEYARYIRDLAKESKNFSKDNYVFVDVSRREVDGDDWSYVYSLNVQGRC